MKLPSHSSALSEADIMVKRLLHIRQAYFNYEGRCETLKKKNINSDVPRGCPSAKTTVKGEVGPHRQIISKCHFSP